MPMPRSIVRRDGHDHLRQTDEDAHVFPIVPQRASRSRASQAAPVTDDVMVQDEEATDDRFDHPTQGIITLTPKTKKTRPRQPTRQLPPPRQIKKPSPRQQHQVHWLVPVGIGMLCILALYILSFLLWTSARGIYNDWTYGTTRTYHLEAVVGDHDSAANPTHFVAMNLHGTIDIIELPGGDVTHAKVYPGPHLLWSDANKAVVTLEAKDVNGDHKPDIVVHIQGDTDLLFQQTTANFVLINNGSGFNSLSELP